MNETLTALIEAADKATSDLDVQTLVDMTKIMDARNNPNFDMETLTRALDSIFSASAQYLRVTKAARNAVEALRASIERDKAIEAYVANLRHEGDLNGLVQRTVDEEVEGRLKGVIADELQSLLEGRK